MSKYEKLKAAAEAATPGPWHAPGTGEIHMQSHDSIAQICFRHDFAEPEEKFGTDADAVFIAAANPAAVLALLSERDALLAALKLAEVALQNSAPQMQHYASAQRRHFDAKIAVSGAIALAESDQ